MKYYYNNNIRIPTGDMSSIYTAYNIRVTSGYSGSRQHLRNSSALLLSFVHECSTRNATTSGDTRRHYRLGSLLSCAQAYLRDVTSACVVIVVRGCRLGSLLSCAQTYLRDVTSACAVTFGLSSAKHVAKT